MLKYENYISKNSIIDEVEQPFNCCCFLIPQILLNLAASIGLTMAVFLSIALDAGLASDASCITLGVLLHYSVLASFCWMLVSASLQFLRFVVVLSSRPPHFLLKGVLFGWVLPFLPIFVLLVISPSRSYPHSAPDSGFCYPSGLGLILAVILPVASAVFANLIVGPIFLPLNI